MRHGILAGLALWIIIFMLAGCSVKFELGYHGETGRDDRVQTQLKNGGKS